MADGNIVNDFVYGSLSVFYGSSNIIFSNNNCLRNKESVNRLFYYSNPDSYRDFCTVKLIGNTFTSDKSFQVLLIQGGYCNSDLYFENNVFNNVCIRSEDNTNPILHINNNKFYVDTNIEISSSLKFFINMAQTECKEVPQSYIKGNLFKANFNATGYTVTNNSTFDDFYPIKFSGSRWRGNICLQIEENTFLGFANIMHLNHHRINGNESNLFVNFYRNKTSGKIINDSDAYGFVIFDNNKAITNDFTTLVSKERNYPNTIPTGNENYGFFASGIKIYFDTPDTDGYTGAICVTGGNPGTWKRFGKIES